MTTQLIEKLIQRQINQWNSYRAVLGRREAGRPPEPRPIVTVSRQLGSGGGRLAFAVAERLDLQMHGHEIIDRIAQDRRLERHLIAHLDEQALSQVQLWVQGVLNRRIFLRDEFHVALVRAVRTLAAQGGVVILGRGGNFILGENASLRVRLVASLESRVRRLAELRSAPAGEIREEIARADEARARFVSQLFHADIDDPRHYDLVLNSDRWPADDLIELTLKALTGRRRETVESGARVMV